MLSVLIISKAYLIKLLLHAQCTAFVVFEKFIRISKECMYTSHIGVCKVIYEIWHIYKKKVRLFMWYQLLFHECVLIVLMFCGRI